MSLRRPSPRLILAATATVIVAHALATVNRRLTHAGDFDISRELGRRFLSGEHLYAGGLHYPYMPAAAMVFAPLALLPPWLGFGLRYAAAVACLWLTLRWLARATRPQGAHARTHDPRVMALTLLLASHYILRDLDDGGPHLLLLAAVAGGLWCVDRNRPGLGAAAFGIAMAVKAPHGLLLFLFAWQRRWRLTALTATAAAAWIVAPSIWMGPSSWWSHQREWTTTVAASVRGTPLPGPRDSEERIQNQALAPAVARIARRLGVREQATALGAVACLALLIWLVWTTRGRRAAALPATGAGMGASEGIASQCLAVRKHCPPRSTTPAWLREVSAALIAMPLLAPVAWVQHLVVVVPGLVVILTAPRLSTIKRGVALGAYAFLTLVLNRELLGRAAYLELLTCGLHTVALLLLLAVLLVRQPTGDPEVGSANA